MDTLFRKREICRPICALAFWFCVFGAARSFAQIAIAPAIEISTMATPGVNGFTTYFFDVIPPEGASISDVEGRFFADVAGAMRQVNPSGLPTVFNNFNAAIADAGENPLADSQFHFASGHAVVVADVNETSTELTAALAGLAPLNSRFTIAHIVLADGVTGTWQIGVVQNEGPGINRQYHQAGTFGPGIGGVFGDYNHNGTVDAADYVVWRDTLNQSDDDLAADGNGNQQIDAGDYDVWASNFGRDAGTAQLVNHIVPEPAAWILLLFSLPLALLARARSAVSPKLPRFLARCLEATRLSAPALACRRRAS
jgi:hypothetical protein